MIEAVVIKIISLDCNKISRCENLIRQVENTYQKWRNYLYQKRHDRTTLHLTPTKSTERNLFLSSLVGVWKVWAGSTCKTTVLRLNRRSSSLRLSYLMSWFATRNCTGCWKKSFKLTRASLSSRAVSSKKYLCPDAD